MKPVYFPLTAIVSLLYMMHEGASAEIAVVGNEGLVGVAIFMGGTSTTSRAVVQSAGIANMLGVRREGVTAGALKLQQAGLIAYARGKITVLDRKGLGLRTSECHEVVKREYDPLLPHVTAT
jgi:hypothetical protein